MSDFNLSMIAFWMAVLAVNSCSLIDEARGIKSAIREHAARCAP